MSLIVRCNEFFKLALKVSIEKTYNYYLAKLSSFKKPQQAIEFADKHLERIGEGSSRVAYEFENRVLKIAKDDTGVVQNLEESRPSMQKDCTNSVIMSDPNGIWMVVGRAKKITKKRFEEIVGAEFDNFCDALFYKFNNESDDFVKPDNYEEICSNELFCSVSQLVFDNDLQVGDLAKIDSWGESEDRAVLVDFGLTRDVWDEYYR